MDFQMKESQSFSPAFDNNFTQNLINRLREDVAQGMVKVERAKRDAEERAKLTRDIENAKMGKLVLEKTIFRFKQLIADTDDFISYKHESLLRDITLSIYKSRAIVKECENIIPKYEKGKFWLESEKTGRAVNRGGGKPGKREGEGVKSLLSLFCQHMILINTPHIPVLVLDECVTDLNEANSHEFSKYLPIMGKEMLIIIIEQKAAVYSNIPNLISYRVEKKNGVSHLICETPELLRQMIQEGETSSKIKEDKSNAGSYAKEDIHKKGSYAKEDIPVASVF